MSFATVKEDSLSLKQQEGQQQNKTHKCDIFLSHLLDKSEDNLIKQVVANVFLPLAVQVVILVVQLQTHLS